VSVECFEHFKNYRVLMARLAAALKPAGRMFVHVFVHRTMPYHFEASGPADWMARHFFTGGTMPSYDLLPRCAPASLALLSQHAVNGVHYSRTLEAWLAKHDAAKESVRRAMVDAYGEAGARTWGQRWRIFYMACSELFKYNGGNTWFVAHYVWEKEGGGGGGGGVSAS
jgi:cyclopropane-fatty-acyl-phospholipid synthase